VTISFEQAVRGTTVEVRLNTPDRSIDETISVKVPAGIGSGKRLRIKERGIPQRDGTRGDQFVRVLVQLPTGLTEEEKKQLAAMDQAHGFEPRKGVGW
jgi:DnaJ-class molecular chaperone